VRRSSCLMNPRLHQMGRGLTSATGHRGAAVCRRHRSIRCSSEQTARFFHCPQQQVSSTVHIKLKPSHLQRLADNSAFNAPLASAKHEPANNSRPHAEALPSAGLHRAAINTSPTLHGTSSCQNRNGPTNGQNLRSDNEQFGGELHWHSIWLDGH